MPEPEPVPEAKPVEVEKVEEKAPEPVVEQEPVAVEETPEEVEPAKPEEPAYEDKEEKKYRYSVDAIVKSISAQHKKRVATKKAEHAANVQELKASLKPKIGEVKTEFKGKLEQLSSDRYETLQAAYDKAQAKISDLEEAHNLEVTALDEEAIAVIESIIEKHKENYDLTYWIDSLEKDWFNIVWDFSNRREKR